MAAFACLIYRRTTMNNCNNAVALANFTYWTQTDKNALHIADRYNHSLSSFTPWQLEGDVRSHTQQCARVSADRALWWPRAQRLSTEFYSRR
jgi:hypothetical protein